MLNIIYSRQFKKDYQSCIKRGLDMSLLKNIVATLAIPAPPASKEPRPQFDW